MKHELKDGTLRVVSGGIEAECVCGWSSIHFSSFTASAAFRDHQENAEGLENYQRNMDVLRRR
jgi:hypothetical protein